MVGPRSDNQNTKWQSFGGIIVPMLLAPAFGRLLASDFDEAFSYSFGHNIELFGFPIVLFFLLMLLNIIFIDRIRVNTHLESLGNHTWNELASIAVCLGRRKKVSYYILGARASFLSGVTVFCWCLGYFLCSKLWMIVGPAIQLSKS